jgi:hypothetical protein
VFGTGINSPTPAHAAQRFLLLLQTPLYGILALVTVLARRRRRGAAVPAAACGGCELLSWFAVCAFVGSFVLAAVTFSLRARLAIVESLGAPLSAAELRFAFETVSRARPGAALALGDRKESVRIYEKLGDQSADAMIFLSKEAFAAGDFADARKWTATLARRFPEQPEFRKNLIKIDEAEAAKPK